MRPISVLLADDQPMIRTGFRYILEAEPDIEVVGEAADGHEAVEETRRLTPDVVLTTFDLDQHVVDALRAGAGSFLVKDGPADSLVAAIRTVAAGEAVLAPRVTKRLLDRFAGLSVLD